jgi:hypothetical protein
MQITSPHACNTTCAGDKRVLAWNAANGQMSPSLPSGIEIGVAVNCLLHIDTDALAAGARVAKRPVAGSPPGTGSAVAGGRNAQAAKRLKLVAGRSGRGARGAETKTLQGVTVGRGEGGGQDRMALSTQQKRAVLAKWSLLCECLFKQ